MDKELDPVVILPPGEIGMASFIWSSFFALKNTFDLSTNSFSIAFFPSSNRPLGTLPSGQIPFSYTTLSFSSLKVLNIFIILLIALTLFLKSSFPKILIDNMS
jgi:hypothetical protein